MDIAQVVKELRQPVWTIMSGDKYVTYITESEEGLVVCLLQSHFFRVLHEEVSNDRGK